MPEKAVLFEIQDTLIRETKDVSDAWYESIRFVYGLTLDDIKISDYEGFTIQETLIDILTKNGLSRSEINEKLEQFFEEFPYGHYNVAGHDKAVLVNGAKELLERIKKNGKYAVGASSGQLERVLKNMFQRVDLNYDSYFDFGVYGNSAEDMTKILASAAEKAHNDFGIGKDDLLFISNAKKQINAAQSLGIDAVGVMTDEFSRKDLVDAGTDKIVKNLKDCERFLK